jgi:hypothetical protein
VDGPLIPFGGPPEEYPRYPAPVREGGEAGPGEEGNPLLERLDPRHGERLRALPCAVVWATTWMDEANAWIAPRLGLPALPVLEWPEPSEAEERRDEREGLHWKTRGLVSRAAGRPFVWVDDEIGEPDRTWVAVRHPGPALLHRVDARTGLTDDDYAVLGAWLRRPS